MKVRPNNLICIISICAVGALVIASCKRSGEYSGPVNALRRYPYERLHMTYEYSGDVRGTEEFYFSDYGKYEARYTKIEIIGTQGIKSSDNGSITRLQDIFNIDFARKTIIHDRPPTLDSLYHLDDNMIPGSQAYLEFEMKRNFFHNIGTDIINGKSASRWERDNGSLTVWMWNCILLRKRVVSSDGSLDLTVKNIDSLWTVDTSKFSIPSGFTTTEAKNIQHAPSSN